MRTLKIGLLLVLAPAGLLAQKPARLDILLPERTRLLVRQRIDLVIEARNVNGSARFTATANGEDIAGRFSAPAKTELDCNGTAGLVYRADLFEFAKPGRVKLTVKLQNQGDQLQAERDIEIEPFTLPETPRNYVLFIGDGMGNAYRDAGRIVGRSVETRPGVPGMREGFFDRLQEMDQMPVTGLVMTYGFAALVPDSAETGTHWSTGNKPLTGMLAAFPDGTDCRWRRPGGTKVGQAVPPTDVLDAVRDNPKIETFLEYLKRLHHYRTGDISTAFLTDATPAAQASHVATRGATFEIARQYLENPMQNGSPAIDVLMGGGKEDFDADVRPDRRDLVAEFRSKHYSIVSSATELTKLQASTDKVLGLFRRVNQPELSAAGLTVKVNGNMQPAYDKLGLLGRANARPGSEPLPDFGIWKDQPFLDEMTRRALAILAGPKGDQPFALQVEGALIDKESHPNHAAGTIWDVIELDKAVGVARAWARDHSERPTLILVTADHDQTMSILGVADVSDRDLNDRKPVATGKGTYYRDARVNLRSGLGLGNVPAEIARSDDRTGFPDYQDTDGDGYPENREVHGKGRKRLVVGFRTGGHAGTSVPITAEGPGALLFTGYLDQTDIFFRSAEALGQDRTVLDRLLGEFQTHRLH
jgi:alkaline phosphatase